MESLFQAIDETPIIDHHAHNLLLPSELAVRPFLSITTEAGDGALQHTPSTLSHIRAVKQLAEILDCNCDWDSVQEAIAKRRLTPDDAWAKRCFEGIETVLIDDGLDESTVHPWGWHHRLTRSKCKRIVRIEKVAETILKERIRPQILGRLPVDIRTLFDDWETEFIGAIEDAIKDVNVVGFKSVICYRTGLALPGSSADLETLVDAFAQFLDSDSSRLDDAHLSPHFVHLTAGLLARSPKPFQFHTGLGDNDITLALSSPSHLQTFIKAYPTVPIVLLHASYPFTKEAGYLASAYENVYLDIGEVFPMVSQEGQEAIIRESLELCPTEKLFWSTDGHWFPETYLLAVIQVREAMKEVLGHKLSRNRIKVSEAIRIVQDVFFNTSNKLYNLGLTLTPIKTGPDTISTTKGTKITKLEILERFLSENPSTKFIRLQWLDYTATLRVRVIPVKVARELFNSQRSIGITKASLGLLQHDLMVPGFSPVGEYELIPCFDGLRRGDRPEYAIVQGEFRELDGSEVGICPRTLLRNIVERAQENEITFRIGFEVEVVFLAVDTADGTHAFSKDLGGCGHSWSNASALRGIKLMTVVEEIVALLENADIDVVQFHPESAPGQFEFVTGHLEPLQAVDTLLATRNIIHATAEKHGMKATFVPKPFANACGTGAHVHMSIVPEDKYASFYAGILKHLRAIAAFTYCNASSYDRMQDSVWSGGRYVAWGTQNRETPLRKVSSSHWELKCMDGLANPYFAMAAILGAGLQGVLDAEPLSSSDCLGDPALMDDTDREGHGIMQMMPKDLREAMQFLEKDVSLGDIMGHSFVKTYLRVKTAEMEMLEAMSAEDRRQFMLERY